MVPKYDLEDRLTVVQISNRSWYMGQLTRIYIFKGADAPMYQLTPFCNTDKEGSYQGSRLPNMGIQVRESEDCQGNRPFIVKQLDESDDLFRDWLNGR